MTLITNAQALSDIIRASEPVRHLHSNLWLHSWSALPCEDELALVALYRDGKVAHYALCYWRDGEWQSDDGDYSWPRRSMNDCREIGLMWRYFDAAPEEA